MTMHARLLAILVAVPVLGLFAASAAAGTSKDTWRGAWKFEIDRQDQPSLNYYDTRGKTFFRIGCGAHFDMRAVYPGAAKQDATKASITSGKGSLQMGFTGVAGGGRDYLRPHATMFDQPDLGYARDDP